MSPSRRSYVTVADARRAGCREGCTLVLIFPLQGRAHTVLTLRAPHLADHAGQVSLPGGCTEIGEDADKCALREAEEELGIAAARLELLGELTPLYIPPSGFCVSSVVAYAAAHPGFTPQESEVAEVIQVPLDDIADGSMRRVERRSVDGHTREIPYYLAGPHKVWGATAMILGELGAVWREAVASTGGSS